MAGRKGSDRGDRPGRGGRSEKSEKSNDSSGEGNRRLLRVEKQIREVVGTYLISGFHGELQGLVSVSRVSASRDLRQARVYISVMGEESEREASINLLRDNAYDVQSEINRKLQMKFCPKLSFFLDEGFHKMLKVEKILHDLKVSQPGGSAEDGSDDADESAD
jgi:ribosome-binding factor A